VEAVGVVEEEEETQEVEDHLEEHHKEMWQHNHNRPYHLLKDSSRVETSPPSLMETGRKQNSSSDKSKATCDTMQR
jgi:hypothetical protein